MRSRPDTVARRAGGDDGFTLIEVLVAVAVIAVVMLGLGAVFVATASGTDSQGLRQTAVRVATDGVDRVRGLGADVVRGRTAALVGTTWPAAVSRRLAGLPVATDPRVTTGTTATPSLPLQVVQTVDRLAYTQSFYVAGCQLTSAGACLATATTDTVPMYDVVVSVAWRHSSCARSACTYQLSTLIAASTSDPLFNSTLKASGPTVTTAASQTLDVGEAVSGPDVTVTGGNGTVSLIAVGLPAGIVLQPGTTAFSGRATAVTATTSATVTATDQFGLSSSTTITWTVNPLPTLTAATVGLVTGVGATIDLGATLGRAGGTGPYTWNCGVLPAGLTLDRTAGTLTALLPVVATLTPACTVTDARGKTATATLTLSALAPLTITSPANNATTSIRRGVAVRNQFTVTGCSGTCTWSADRLPSGIVVSATGAVSGTPTTFGTTTTTLTVVDGTRRATATLTWTVTL